MQKVPLPCRSMIDLVNVYDGVYDVVFQLCVCVGLEGFRSDYVAAPLPGCQLPALCG